MLKTCFLFLITLLSIASHSFSQCLSPLPPPDCSGTEPLVADGETIGSTVIKWYYGATLTMNSVSLDGGTLVVCGDLTIDKFYITTGTIFIRPGSRLVIGSGIGAGLQFKGNCAIYNYGTCEIQRNLTLENNATAATPNIVINVTPTSVFKMSNQYFVINNEWSWFVNNGYAEFWGIITDQQSSQGSVCLGNGSTTKMAILINKIANSYTAPSGNACLYVFQFSEFYGQLSSSPTLFVCLSASHNSNSSCIPFGCQPNNWGSAQVFTNCAGCGSIAVLSVKYTSFMAVINNEGMNMLKWETALPVNEGIFTVLRSADGKNFYPIDSIPADRQGSLAFNLIDKHPLQGNNYYMIRYTKPGTESTINSKVAKLWAESMIGFNLYPTPFDNKFYINYPPGTYPQKVLLTDMSGRSIRIKYIIHGSNQPVEVFVLDHIETGVYLVHLQTNKNTAAKTIIKR